MPARVLRSLASLGLAALALIGAVPAGALETNTLGISPSDEADNFHVDLLPGEGTDRRAVITNYTDKAERLLVYPVDATITSQGGFALAERDAARTGVGAWVQLPVTEVTVAPHSTAPVPFHLSVPADAAPGDYAGGIVIETEPKGKPQEVTAGYAFQFNIVERIGVRIYLNVAGEAVRGLEAGKVSWKRTDEGIRFSVPISNTGNVRLEPQAELGFRGFRMPARSIAMSRVETLLPGGSTILTGLWERPPLVADGNVTATVSFGGEQPAQSSTHLRLFPLGLAAGVLLGLAAAGLGSWRLVRFIRNARAALRLVNAGAHGAGKGA